MHDIFSIERRIQQRDMLIEYVNEDIDKFLFFLLWRFLNCKRNDPSLTFYQIYDKVLGNKITKQELLIELERRFQRCLEILETQRITEIEIAKEQRKNCYFYLQSILEN